MMLRTEGQLFPGHELDVERGFEGQVPLGQYDSNKVIARLALVARDGGSYCTAGVFVTDGGFASR